jgi:hypothetical protein
MLLVPRFRILTWLEVDAHGFSWREFVKNKKVTISSDKSRQPPFVKPPEDQSNVFPGYHKLSSQVQADVLLCTAR